MNAHEINDLFEQESPAGQLYVRLKELGIPVEREWFIDEEGIAYIVDHALPVEDGWLPVTFGDRPGPNVGLRFAAVTELDICLLEIKVRLQADVGPLRGYSGFIWFRYLLAAAMSLDLSSNSWPVCPAKTSMVLV
jgi:hypothetical protein